MSKVAVLSLASIISVLVSMKAALIGLSILIFVDLITGIRKNHYEWGIKFQPHKAMFWKSIKSYLLRKTWRKTYEYGLGILVILVFEHLVIGKASIELMDRIFTITELAIVLPAIIEIWSIFENFEAVSGSNMLKRLMFLLPPKVRSLFDGKEHTEENITPTDGVNQEGTVKVEELER